MGTAPHKKGVFVIGWTIPVFLKQPNKKFKISKINFFCVLPEVYYPKVFRDAFFFTLFRSDYSKIFQRN